MELMHENFVIQIFLMVVDVTTLKMAGSQWSYKRKIQPDALGKVNRVKEIRRKAKDGLKITDNGIMWGRKFHESQVWGEEKDLWGKFETEGREQLWSGWEGNEKCGQATSQILGPPGTDFSLSRLQDRRGRLEECRKSWMMKKKFDKINFAVKSSYNLK